MLTIPFSENGAHDVRTSHFFSGLPRGQDEARRVVLDSGRDLGSLLVVVTETRTVLVSADFGMLVRATGMFTCQTSLFPLCKLRDTTDAHFRMVTIHCCEGESTQVWKLSTHERW